MSTRDTLRAKRAQLEREIAQLDEMEADLDAAAGVNRSREWPSAADWLEEDLGTFDWLVGGLITAGSISMLAADPGAGKTTLLTQMTLALANGRPFCGMHVARVWRTMYAAAEGARLPLRNRYQQACRSLDIGERSANWYIQPREFGEFRLERGGIEAAVKRHVPHLVILDTLGYFGLDDENDAGTWKDKIMAPLRRMAAAHGTGFLLVHHLRKGGGELASRVRGTSAMWGDVDHLLALDAPHGQEDPYRELWVLKSKYSQSMVCTALNYDATGAVFIVTERDRRVRRGKGEDF